MLARLALVQQGLRHLRVTRDVAGRVLQTWSIQVP